MQKSELESAHFSHLHQLFSHSPHHDVDQVHLPRLRGPRLYNHCTFTWISLWEIRWDIYTLIACFSKTVLA